MLQRVVSAEKEFAPEERGTRVGWVRTAVVDQGRPFVAVDMTTAAITGDDGAEFGYSQWVGDTEDETSLPYPYVRGFGQAASFSAFLSHEADWQEEFNMDYTPFGGRGPGYRPTIEQLLDRGSGLANRHTIDTPRHWARGGAQLAEALRENLASRGFQDAYSRMYYWVNGSIGRESPLSSDLSEAPVESYLLPDATMYDATREQITNVEALLAALSESIAHDHQLRAILESETVASLPELFVASRQKAYGLEQTISEISHNLAVRRLAYTPPGKGRGSRTWPYMDATESDPDRAYGLELRQLEEGVTAIPLHEVKRELKELQARRTLAAEALQRFLFLNREEEQLLERSS